MRTKLFAFAVFACLSFAVAQESPADPYWRWWQWPSKEVVFRGIGEPSRIGKAWFCKLGNGGSVKYEANRISVALPIEQRGGSLMVDWPSVNSGLYQLCQNLFPYWDGAKETISVYAWVPGRVEDGRLEYNQYDIDKRLEVRDGVVVLVITPRPGFSWEAMRDRATAGK